MNRNVFFSILIVLLNLVSINNYAQLNGSYAIGPSAPNFKTITQAVLQLYLQGVMGPVTFNIEDGIYDEQVYIPWIKNASVNNLVTFQSASGDSSKVIIKFKPTADSMNYTLMLDGVSYLVFKRLTFKTDTISGRIIDINNQCSFNQFINNRIIGMKDGRELVYSKDTANSVDNYNRFENNLFQYGSIGLFLAGADNTTLEQGTDIFKNKFIDQSQMAIQMKYCYNFKVRSNIISTTSGLYDYTGIRILRCNDKFWVEKNKIDISNQSQTCQGIAVILSNGSSSANASSISNNFIHIYSNEFVFVSGLEIYGSFKNFYYNSVNLTGNNENSVGFYDIIGSDINILNNIFSNQAKGLSITLNDTLKINSDYNNFYTNGSMIGSYSSNSYTDLTNWKTSLKKDQHSVSADPNYFSNTDLHIKNFKLSKKGKTVSGVTDDIDGNARKSPNPDIGADEFVYKFDLGADRNICAGLTTKIIAEQGFDSYLWSTGDTTSAITVDSVGAKSGSKKIKLAVNYQGNVFSDSVNINFIKPVISIGTDRSVCKNELITLSATGGIKYTWNTGDTNANLQFISDQTVRYSVKGTDQYGCTDSAKAWVKVRPVPATPVISRIGKDSLECSVTGSNYSWLLNRFKTTYKTKKIKPAVYGLYEVIVYDSACPSDTSASYDYQNNSIQTISGTSKMIFYPNPANSSLIIEVYNFDPKQSEIDIISVVGKIEYHIDRVQSKNELDISALQKGYYFIRFNTGKHSIAESLIIE
jgi:hypothetical protein